MSRWFRGLVFGGLVLASIAAFLTYPLGSTGAQWILIWSLLVAGLPLVWFSIEGDAGKPPRAPSRPAGPWLAPFVPGSGRGALLLTLSLCVVLGSFLAARAIHDAGEPLFGDDDPTQLATICMYALCYGLLAAVLTGFGRARRRAKLACFVGLFVLSIGLQFFYSASWPDDERELLSPILFLEEVRQDGGWSGEAWKIFVILASITTLLLAVSIPHMMAGVRDLTGIPPESSETRTPA